MKVASVKNTNYSITKGSHHAKSTCFAVSKNDTYTKEDSPRRMYCGVPKSTSRDKATSKCEKLKP